MCRTGANFTPRGLCRGHIFLNRAVSGSRSSLAAACLDQMVPPDTDLVVRCQHACRRGCPSGGGQPTRLHQALLAGHATERRIKGFARWQALLAQLHLRPTHTAQVLEFTVNDDPWAGISGPGRRPFEQLLRKLRRRGPAVIILHHFMYLAGRPPEPGAGWTSRVFWWPAEMHYSMLAKVFATAAGGEVVAAKPATFPHCNSPCSNPGAVLRRPQRVHGGCYCAADDGWGGGLQGGACCNPAQNRSAITVACTLHAPAYPPCTLLSHRICPFHTDRQVCSMPWRVGQPLYRWSGRRAGGSSILLRRQVSIAG